MTGKMRVRRNFKCKTDLYVFAFFAAVLFINVYHSGGSLFKDCQDPLIGGRDDQMSSFSATSSIHPDSVQPKLADGWCPIFPKQWGDHYLQVDLRIQVNITGIATRGYKQSWLKNYYLLYSEDGSHWIHHKEPGESYKSLLLANRDSETFVVYRFVKMERARHVRIHPILFEGACCFRFELFGCDGGMRNAVGLNEAKIGPISSMNPMSSGQLWDTAYLYKSVDRSVGWSPQKSLGVFKNYQARLMGIHLLSGFLMQGCSTRQCPPGATLFAVRNLTLNKYGYYDYSHQVSVWYSQSVERFPVKTVVETDSRFSVVHMFSKPIAANEILLQLFYHESADANDICPRGLSYHFCVQMEFYGKDLDCKTPLGIEWSNHHPNGAVKDNQMTAYVADNNYPARFGRYKHSSAWCADPSMLENPEYAKSQFLQIDFLKLKRITGILTQGRGFSSVVTYYYLYYATDQGAFHSFRHGENNEIVLFEGNSGLWDEDHTNWLDHPFDARYIRFNPQRWIKSPCLRVEVYGCDAECSYPLGMEYGLIENHQIKASSETTANKKDWSRLNSVGWCVSGDVLVLQNEKVLYHYLQIDLLEPHLIRGVATQGKEAQNPEDPKERPEAVTSFYLKYSFEGDEWFRYHELLVGEYYGNSVMRYWLEPPLVTRFIEFNPQSSWSNMHVCMRVEVYGCSYKNLAGVSNYLAIGMQSFRISDVQLSASSQADASHSAEYSRLNHDIQGGAWMPAKLDRSEYLQIDLGWVMTLTGIATQGHPAELYRALTYTVKHGITLDHAFTHYPKSVATTLEQIHHLDICYSVLRPVQSVVYRDMVTSIQGLELEHGVLKNRMQTSISRLISEKKLS